jgi:hypothetical protein
MGNSCLVATTPPYQIRGSYERVIILIKGGCTMRHKRTNKDYAGGGGRGIFISDLFSVTHWTHHLGNRTTLEYAEWERIQFPDHINIESDTACIEQLKPHELMKLLTFEKENSYEQGKRDKIKEITSALNL